MAFFPKVLVTVEFHESWRPSGLPRRDRVRGTVYRRREALMTERKKQQIEITRTLMDSLTIPLQAELGSTELAINLIWVMMCTFLVFIMHAGFAMLESGQVRSKNVVNQLTKNIVTWAGGFTLYFLIGHAIIPVTAAIATSEPMPTLAEAFYYWNGAGVGFSGTGASGGLTSTMSDWIYIVFNGAFAATTASIVSGTVAGRMNIHGYAILGTILAGVVFPITFGLHFAGGFVSTLPAGGLNDFAGGIVVHMTGGVAALTAAYLVGPRIEKYRDDGTARKLPGHSPAFTVFGTLILAFGWFGFNNGMASFVFDFGTTGQTFATQWQDIPRVMTNTILVMGAGAIGATIASVYRDGEIKLLESTNGWLAGLVAVCPIALGATWFGTLGVGLLAGFQLPFVSSYLENKGIDDVVDAIPVHGTAAFLGGAAYPFVTTTSEFLSPWSLFSQIVGMSIIGIVTALITAATIFAIRGVGLERASREGELGGLDEHEHSMVAYPQFAPLDDSTTTAEGSTVDDD
ncbi:ammonium transporter [Haloplanus halobius]|uniref:ammonium transporter n=1 Tax=Haloplanus halobius TaxID=2934938 RepID=UPI00200EA405|nr:ammonium transporter [Haloplanus sp. XH21]